MSKDKQVVALEAQQVLVPSPAGEEDSAILQGCSTLCLYAGCGRDGC